MVNQLPRWARTWLTEDDLRAIEAAVREAERRTSAEIVPIIVRSSTDTRLVPWVIFFALTTLALPALLLIPPPSSLTARVTLELALFAMIVLTSALAGHVSLLQRLVCSRAHRLASVERRALFEFHAANLRATRARTGILLFVSLMERRALVLADEAIDRRFTPDHWSTEVSMMVRGAREQRLASGIVEAVRHASGLLASAFPREADDTNELSDRPLIKDQWV